MPVFAFEAMDASGQKLRKEIDAGTRDEAIAKIKGMGLFPTKIKQKRQSGAMETAPEDSSSPSVKPAKPKGKKFVFGRVNLRDLTQFTQQLSTLQDAGLPIVRSLRILEGQLRPSVLKNVLAEVADEVESGSTLSDAMSKQPKAFDRLYVNMIKAGETGGVLDTILDRLAYFMEKSLRLKKKVIGALIYPAVVTVIATAIMAAIMTFVIPSFEAMFKEAGVGSLPMPTELLLTISRSVASWWFLLVAFPFVAIALFRVIVANQKGRYIVDKFKLNMPVFGLIIKKSTIARFTRTLGTLVASGVDILTALAIVKEAIGNEVLAKAVDSVHESIRQGDNIARPLGQSGVFDEIVVNMVDVGEETGELDKMLLKIADNYEEDVDIAVESLTSVIEPILIVGMGGAVGFIVIALFMPLVSLIENLS